MERELKITLAPRLLSRRVKSVAIECVCGKHATGFENSVLVCGSCGAIYSVAVMKIG